VAIVESFGAGLSTEEIAFVALLTALRRRRSKLDRQIDTLTRSREALDACIRVTEQNTDPLAPSTCTTR
jgi:uncharacterized protein YoxC